MTAHVSQPEIRSPRAHKPSTDVTISGFPEGRFRPDVIDEETTSRARFVRDLRDTVTWCWSSDVAGKCPDGATIVRPNPDKPGAFLKPDWMPAFAAASFSPPHRRLENVTSVAFLGADLDETGASVDAARSLGVGGLLYSSLNHSPEKPAFRLLLWLSRPVTAAEYYLLHEVLKVRLGDALGNAKDPSRLWYPRMAIVGRETVFEELAGPDVDVDAWLTAAGGAGAEARDVGVTDVADHPPIGPDHAKWTANVEAFTKRCAVLHDDHGGTTMFELCQWGIRTYRLPPATVKAVITEHYLPRCKGEPWISDALDYKIGQAITRGHFEWDDLGAALSRLMGKKAAPVNDATVPKTTESEAEIDQVGIVVTTIVHEVREAAIAALASHTHIYQRAGDLVQVVQQVQDPKGARNHVGVPVLKKVDTSTLKGELTKVGYWTKGGKPCEPPEGIVLAVHKAGAWPVPPITAIVETPYLKPDGAIHFAPGYDAESGVFLSPGGLTLAPMKDHPTREDARAALAELIEVFCDFSDVSEADRLVPVANILTLLARGAIDGSVPAFLYNGNIPGAGKGLKANVVAMTVTGRRAPITSFPESRTELEKKIGAYAAQGAQILCFDNIAHTFGGDSLEAAVTSGGGLFEARILGKTALQSCKWSTVVMGTGVGVELTRDMARRVLVSSILTKDENPEERTDFRHPQLLAWVKQERARLVAAALTVLRAHALAGRPCDVPAWGSFEEWSVIVAGAIHWACGVDVQDARPSSRDDVQENPEEAELREVLQLWKANVTKVFTVKALANLQGSPFGAAIAQIADRPSPSGKPWSRSDALTAYLRKKKQQPKDGYWIVSLKEKDPHTKCALWTVEKV